MTSEQILQIFNEPGIIAIIGDVDKGKSMLTYDILYDLKEVGKFKLYTFGLRSPVGGIEINSIQELERIRDSIIILDEFISLFDVDDRTAKKKIENTLRLIHHNNNVLMLIGLPENFKKFISAKINKFFFKQSTISDFINGSNVKNILLNYHGVDRGSTMLMLKDSEALYYDGEHYKKVHVKYHPVFDTKMSNPEIVRKNVEENVEM